MCEAGLAKGDRREGGRERALTPQAQVDGKEPRCNGESEPPRRALSPGREGIVQRWMRGETQGDED